MNYTFPASINPRRCADAIVTLLKSGTKGINIAIGQLNAAYYDTISVRTVDATAYYDIPDLDRYDKYPCVVLFPGLPTDPPDQLAGFHNRFHRIVIVTYEMGNQAATGKMPPEVMARRVERMMEAMTAVLDGNRTLTVTGAQASIENIHAADFFRDGRAIEMQGQNLSLLRQSAQLDIDVIIQ